MEDNPHLESVREKMQDALCEKGQSIVQETRQNNSALSIDEILFLLRSKVVLGRGIPKPFSTSPWRIPDDTKRINDILDWSMQVQSGSIPKSGDFDEFILSNSSMVVSGLLRSYLLALFPGEIECDIVFGVLLWDTSARKSDQDYKGSPYLWMEINGRPVDNTYVDIPNNNKSQQEYFFASRQASSYVKEDPFKTKVKLYLGQEDDLNETVRHNFKIFQAYGNHVNIEKFVLLAFKNSELNPGPRMYDILMRDYLKNSFNFVPQDLSLKWSLICWNCLKKVDLELKTCQGCKLAKYCSRECQKSEWKSHKLLHKELALTKEILSTNAVEEDEEGQVNQMASAY